MHYCLPIGQFVKNETISVQFSSVTSLCTRHKTDLNPNINPTHSTKPLTAEIKVTKTDPNP